ncbi:MAG TPA: hypothetical protein VEY87_10340 [Gaiellaceae bacterium]|nr:hypothetical protein [Gaiellaceae bacterium]
MDHHEAEQLKEEMETLKRLLDRTTTDPTDDVLTRVVTDMLAERWEALRLRSARRVSVNPATSPHAPDDVEGLGLRSGDDLLQG